MSAPATNIPNLWGELPEVSSVLTPTAILNGQAQVLAKMTDGLLTARTELARDGQDFEITMNIVATSLDNYYYEVLRIKHGVDLYPAWVLGWDKEPQVECENYQALEKAVAQVLQSDRVRRVIRGLLAQVRYNRIEPFLDPLARR
jgi:hypothetical protein